MSVKGHKTPWHFLTYKSFNEDTCTCILHLHVIIEYTYSVVIPLGFPLLYIHAYMQDVVQTLWSWAIVVILTYKHVFICYCSYHCMATVSYDRQPDGNSFIQATFLRFARISLPRVLPYFHVEVHVVTLQVVLGKTWKHFLLVHWGWSPLWYHAVESTNDRVICSL